MVKWQEIAEHPARWTMTVIKELIDRLLARIQNHQGVANGLTHHSAADRVCEGRTIQKGGENKIESAICPRLPDEVRVDV